MSVNSQVFSPYAYFGGKQRKVKHILPYFPMHNIYIEPFFGGGALFFAKELAKINVINDIKKDVVNFLNILKDKDKFDLLIHKLTYTAYSVESIIEAKKILNDYNVNSVDFAWAFFVMQQMAFVGMHNTTLACYVGDNRAKVFFNKVNDLHFYINKLHNTYILNKDAIDVINQYNEKSAFVYCDPPYINTADSSYLHYSEKQYIKLLETLKQFKGKFLLSGYDNEFANKYFNYKTTFITDKNVGGSNTKQIECLWSNYPLKELTK